MWQIRRFKSSIFCKLKAKFNMHFKLQKDPSFPLQWSEAWMSLCLNIFWDINLEILRLESVYSYSNSIYRMKIVHYWNLIYSARHEAWRKVANKSTTQICSQHRRLDTFQIPQMFCPESRQDTSSEVRNKLSQSCNDMWVIHFIKPRLAIIFSSIVFA